MMIDWVERAGAGAICWAGGGGGDSMVVEPFEEEYEVST